MSAQASFYRLGVAIDNVLVAAPGLRSSLAADHLPFDASLDEGVARYGIGPLFHLWNVCRQIHRLRIEWVGDQTAAFAPPMPRIEPPPAPEEKPVPMVEA
jgi:hypothetical protein